MTLKSIIASIVAFFHTPRVAHALASIEGAITTLEATGLHHAEALEAKADYIAKLTIENAAHEAERLHAASVARKLRELIAP